MDLLELDLNLIPKVYAQSTSSSADALAQPTFGELDLGNGSDTVASVSLTADNTNTAVGSTIQVNVEIKTNAFTVNEYDIVITYDTTKFTVVDADTATAGTQITFLDTVFTVDTGSNIVDSGKITLVAKTSSGNALQVNRTVARITLQAQTVGNSSITLSSGGTGTKLVNQNGVAIATSLNSVTINTTTETSSSSSSSSSSISSSSSSSSSSSLPAVIPDTGIAEDAMSALVPVLAGLVLVVLGVSLAKVRKQKPHE